jgi:hypothetical protein
MVGFMKGLGCGCCATCECPDEENTICEFSDPFNPSTLRSEWLDVGFRPTVIANGRARQCDYFAFPDLGRIVLGKSPSAVSSQFDYAFVSIPERYTRADIQVNVTPPFIQYLGGVYSNRYTSTEYYSRVTINQVGGGFSTWTSVGLAQTYDSFSGIPQYKAYCISDYTPRAPGRTLPYHGWQYISPFTENHLLTFAIERFSAGVARVSTPLKGTHWFNYDYTVADACVGFYITLETIIPTLNTDDLSATDRLYGQFDNFLFTLS